MWLKGEETGDNFGDLLTKYGTQGVPASSNTPGARYEAIFWRGGDGYLYLYGGYGFKGSTTQRGELSDMWKYDPSTNMWTWLSGTKDFKEPPDHGTKGVPAASNTPGARLYGSPKWVDEEGNLWLFGGANNLSNPGAMMNDLWKYDLSTNLWTWVSGSDQSNQTANYGMTGVPSVSNNPGMIHECTANWVDDDGHFWLFGGGIVGGPNSNELWEYNPATNEWTFHGGSIKEYWNKDGIYGTKGVPSSSNWPHQRYAYTAFKDTNNLLWMYGGSELAIQKYFNDVWNYNTSTGMWTWMKGDSTEQESEEGSNIPPVYGTNCMEDAANTPGARHETPQAWCDDCGHLWMFGGVLAHSNYGSGQYKYFGSDLWRFNPYTNNWMWVDGPVTTNEPGVTGTQGVPDPSNNPKAMAGAAAWRDSSGFYLFGGQSERGFAPTWVQVTWLNTLWKWIPDPPVADFTPLDTTTDDTSLTLNFSNFSTICCNFGIKSYYWDFGDGTFSSEENPVHTYSMGVYHPMLITTSCLGNKDTAIGEVNVGNLPVDLINFDGWSNGKSNQLIWETATEFNNDRFVLERSVDGKNFSAVATVKGKGFSSKRAAYTYSDYDIKGMTYYYRLRQIDFDGTFSLSNIVCIQPEVTGNAINLNRLFPNPASGNINIEIASKSKTTVDVVIYSIGGQSVFKVQRMLSSGSNLINLDISGLGKANYILRVYDKKSSNIIEKAFKIN